MHSILAILVVLVASTSLLAQGTVRRTQNLSGTWTEGTGTHTMILSQTGNNLSGKAIGNTAVGVIQTSSATGTVSGGSVSLTETDTPLVSQDGVSVATGSAR